MEDSRGGKRRKIEEENEERDTAYQLIERPESSSSSSRKRRKMNPRLTQTRTKVSDDTNGSSGEGHNSSSIMYDLTRDNMETLPNETTPIGEDDVIITGERWHTPLETSSSSDSSPRRPITRHSTNFSRIRPRRVSHLIGYEPN